MIDWSRVNDLREEIGPESFDEVAELFLEEVDEAVAKLDGPMTPKALESGLHFVKGSALNLGFQTLAALCQAGERTAANGSTDVDLGEIRVCYDASKAAFQAGLLTALSA
jgi:HPt (histidine-containing phosphotransfer) domain-containing protein